MTPVDNFQRFTILQLTHQGVTGGIKGANFSEILHFVNVYIFKGVNIDDFGGLIDVVNYI